MLRAAAAEVRATIVAESQAIQIMSLREPPLRSESKTAALISDARAESGAGDIGCARAACGVRTHSVNIRTVASADCISLFLSAPNGPGVQLRRRPS